MFCSLFYLFKLLWEGTALFGGSKTEEKKERNPICRLTSILKSQGSLQEPTRQKSLYSCQIHEFHPSTADCSVEQVRQYESTKHYLH